MGLILEGSQPLLPAAASGTVTSTDITDSTAAGRSLLTAASAAAQRAALGAGGITEYTAADLALVQGGGACAASIVSGRLRCAIDTNATRRYGLASGVWTADCPRGVFAVPAGAREVVAAVRVYVTTAQIDYNLLGVFARRGADPAAPTAPAAGVRLPVVELFNAAVALYGGEGYTETYPTTVGGGGSWPLVAGAEHYWFGLRCTPGLTQVVSWTDATDTPAIDLADMLSGYAGVATSWRMPTEIVIAAHRVAGGASTALSVDADVRIWVAT